MTPQQPLSVTLTAEQWEAVMRLLADGPYRIAAPLIQTIQQQCMAGSARAPVPTLAANVPANGGDERG
jgi:hypothetical protein